ncbi:MAG: toxin-antitoxin system YwqK family antitoxin [Sphingobacteriales bacterium]
MNLKSPFFILFFFFYGLNCFAQDTLFLDAKWNKTVHNNAIYTSVTKKQGSGWLRTDYFTKTGQLQMKGTVSSIDPEIREGYFEWYFENGKLKHKGNYINGKETGQHLWYNENGNLEANESFINGIRTGAYEEYFPNGKLKDKSSYLNGLQTGWTEYYREDGSKQSEGNFKNNNRDGIWKYYDEKGGLLGIDTVQTEYTLNKANMFLQLPNDEWYLAVNQAPDHYIFKRHPVTDSKGRNIIPAIMIYVVDAQKFNQDVKLYSDNILKRFPDLKITETLKWGDLNYPLKYRNALFLKAEYTQNEVGHIIYLIHIINKQNTGIQIYLDMTKDIAEKYEPEFWTTINSIKEIN